MNYKLLSLVKVCFYQHFKLTPRIYKQENEEQINNGDSQTLNIYTSLIKRVLS